MARMPFGLADNARNMTIAVNIEMPCPVPGCGGTVRAITGTFDTLGDEIIARDAPPRTHAILDAIREAVKSAQEGATEDEIIATLSDASPEFAAAAAVAIRKWGIGLFVTFLITMLSNCNQTIDYNELLDQIHVYSTGAAPYAGFERSDSLQTESERKAAPNRHQRRQQAHQTKRQQRRTAPQTGKKPK